MCQAKCWLTFCESKMLNIVIRQPPTANPGGLIILPFFSVFFPFKLFEHVLRDSQRFTHTLLWIERLCQNYSGSQSLLVILNDVGSFTTLSQISTVETFPTSSMAASSSKERNPMSRDHYEVYISNTSALCINPLYGKGLWGAHCTIILSPLR